MIICIEGCIGVGKTTLLNSLQQLIHCKTIFENFNENPFLTKFYSAPEKYGFAVQTSFILIHSSTYRDATEKNDDQIIISDFHPLKSEIFNSLILKNKELKFANELYSFLTKDLPKADLIIYLRADIDTICERVESREIASGHLIGRDYLRNLQDAYEKYFTRYNGKLIKTDTSDLSMTGMPQFSKDIINEAGKILDKKQLLIR